MGFTLHQGDCIEVMHGMADNSIDSIVTDPPYELGFMGKSWDNTGIANSVTMWVEALRVLKPGGHLLAFSGSRTYHRMVCAIEDAGFEVRDQIMWIYGSGFPKSHNLDGEFDGWGTALKPAHEPICVARKPLIGTVAVNVLAHCTGALNIDACRVAGDMPTPYGNPTQADGWRLNQRETDWQPSAIGRWPANIIHDGSAEVLAAFPTAPGQQAPKSFTAPSSKTRNTFGARGRRPGGFGNVGAESGDSIPNGPMYTDSGSAARFFYCAKASKEDRNEGCGALPLKASGMVSNTSGQHITRRDGGAPGPTTNHHPTVKPTDLMAYLCRLVTPPGGTVLDPFMGSGSTGKAAMLEGFNFIGIDLSPEYVEIARARIEHAQRQGHQPSLDLESA